MGRAEKLKEQRKIEKVRKQLGKEKKIRLTMFIFFGLVLGSLLGTGVYFGVGYAKDRFFPPKTEATKSYKTGERTYSQAPEMQIDTSKTYVVKFDTTEGNFEVTLNTKEAPKTVNNFVALTRDEFYDGLTFHRIVKDFMIQGGDPEGTGGGGPGYKFDDEPIVGDYASGTIAMANSGANTNGSQFFIMTGDYSGGKLPKNYVIFGNVTTGMDVILKLNETETTDNGQGEQSKPISTVTINKVTIEEK
jgi:cyclophilin family peptidyl-prolyl cis-trans isomerase